MPPGTSAHRLGSTRRTGRSSRRRRDLRPQRPLLRAASPPTASSRRLSVSALVVEGPDGSRLRAGQERFLHPAGPDLPPHGTATRGRATAGISRRDPDDGGDPQPLLAVSTRRTSWGVWTFQDVFDVRFYNYYAPSAWRRRWRRRPREPEAGAGRGASVSSVRQDPPALVRPGDGRRRDARPATATRDTDHDMTVDPVRRHLATRRTRSRSRTSSTSGSTPSSSRATT